MMRSAAKSRQGSALVQGHVVGLVAPDGILRFVCARMVQIAFVPHVARVDLDDSPRHAAGPRVPADVIAHLEPLRHAPPVPAQPPAPSSCARRLTSYTRLSRHGGDRPSALGLPDPRAKGALS